MSKENEKLKLAQEETQAAIDQTNKMIEKLGEHTSALCSALNDIQELFDRIRNMPSEKKIECDEMKSVRLNWKQQAEKIEQDYEKAVVKNAGVSAAGIGAGVAVAALGPTAAMGIATTFGVASTGTAISALSGAAATNAALAWLGGGALVAGGGGMAAGEAILALAGPVGWAIAGLSVAASACLYLKSQSDKELVEGIFTSVSKRDVESYKLAIVELSERISRIDRETEMLLQATEQVKIYGTDYNDMTEAQQYELGSYVNLMKASTQLLVNPVMGLQPKFTKQDIEAFLANRTATESNALDEDQKEIVLMLANFLYKIEMDSRSKKVIYNNFRKNKELFEEMGVDRNRFTLEIMDVVEDALSYSYSTSN